MDTNIEKYRNYFIVNGEKYYTGTVFIINDCRENKEVTFICYDTENNRYIFKDKRGCVYNYPHDWMQKFFVAVTNKVDEKAHMPRLITAKDSHINGLALGWLWYIFLMVIATIFKDNIGLWVLISIAFFSWRHKKIKKEGTYVEW